MNKRILSILLCLLLVASLLVLAIPAGAAPTERMQLKVVADKESAKAGDTVAYQIVMGPVTEVGSIQMTVDIPAGLSYVAGSGKVAEGVTAAMGFDNISWEESSLILNGYASAADYASTDDTVLATFECTVDEEAAGTLSVGLTEIEMGSCQTFEVFSDLFDVVAADVTVEGAAPVDPTDKPSEAPTDEPTEAPAPCEHVLKHVDEVPATTEADGIKAHYVCEKCGKLFEDAFGTVELTEADLVIPKIVPVDPTDAPVVDPTDAPVVDPTDAPVVDPTDAPVVDPTEAPVVDPTVAPTVAPTTVASVYEFVKNPYKYDHADLDIILSGFEMDVHNTNAALDKDTLSHFQKLVINGVDVTADFEKEDSKMDGLSITMGRASAAKYFHNGDNTVECYFDDAVAPATTIVQAVNLPEDTSTKDTASKDSSTKDTATKDTSSSTSSPKTGDSTNMYLWMLIMLASMVGAGAVLYTAKRKGIFTK